jgi:hypothetical protein
MMNEYIICEICGEPKVVDMSGWCAECYKHIEEDES